MAVRDILLLGDERLYTVAREVGADELEMAGRVVGDLRDTMAAFRAKYAFGRAIAAPQIGEPVRVIYMNFDGKEYALVNPRLLFSGGTFELWDDCMSFPGLEVRLRRHRLTTVEYKDLDWRDCRLEFADDLSELIQHEYDHLDGILAVQRAIDDRAFRVNVKKAGCF